MLSVSGNHEDIANNASQNTGEDPSFFKTALQHATNNSVSLVVGAYRLASVEA